MMDQFYTHETIERHCTHDACGPNAAQMQYCRLEQVSPGELKCAADPGNSIRIRLEHLAFHALSRMDKSLDFMIKRLMADLERSGRVEGYLS
jgi:hypothetical protein